MTTQAKMKAMLEKTGLPYKEIECYGSQIVVTSWSAESANKWASLLAKFSKVRGITRSVDYCKEETQKKRTTLHPAIVEVYRTFAAVV